MGVAGARARRGGLVFGAMAAEAVFTAARLRGADLLGDGQRSGAATPKKSAPTKERSPGCCARSRRWKSYPSRNQRSSG